MPVSPKAFFVPFAVMMAVAVSACDDKQAAAPQIPPPEVVVQTIQPQRVPLYTDLPGRTASFRIAEVRPQVGGIVLKRLFEEGSEVKAGQQLYQIDPATYQAAVQSALANLASARANLHSVEARAARYSDLVKINAVSRQDYDDAIASLDQAKAQIMVSQASVDTARINLGYTKVYAPIDGRIGKSAVTEGALVTADQSTALATITQLDPIYVDVNQSSSELMRLRQAAAAGLLKTDQTDQAPVSLTLDGSDHVYDQTGQLKFSEVTVDQTTGAVQVRAVFPNPDKQLYPGLFVRARIEQGVRENALLVPQRAVVRNADGSASVWVVGADNKTTSQRIVTEQTVGDNWLINDGLKAGDRVVVEGLPKVKSGVEVRPLDAASGNKAAPAASQH